MRCVDAKNRQISRPGVLCSGIRPFDVRHAGCFPYRILCFILIGVAMRPLTATADASVLPSYTRAAYQMCLENDLPISYQRIDDKAKASVDDTPVRRAHALLNAMGFQSEIRHLMANEAAVLATPCIIADETGKFCLVVRRYENRRQLIDYPQKPLDITPEKWARLWPRDAVVVTQIPTRDYGKMDVKTVPAVADFGVIEQGEVVTIGFAIENITDKPAEVLAISTSCGCTLAQGQLGPLPLGQKRACTVKFSSAQRNGYQEVYCAIRTNLGTSLLRVSGFVKSESAYYPKSIDFGSLTPQAKPVEQSIAFVTDSLDGARPLISVTGPEWADVKTEQRTHAIWRTPEDRVVITCDPKRLGIGSREGDLKATYRVGMETRTVSIPIAIKIVDAKLRSLLLKATNMVPGERFSRSIELPQFHADTILDFRQLSSSEHVMMSVRRDDRGRWILQLDGVLYNGHETTEGTVTFCGKAGDDKTAYTAYVLMITQ